MGEKIELLTVPEGLEGVAVARTAIGDVRGREGFYHYHQYSAVELAAKRTFEDVWQLLLEGALPDGSASSAFANSTVSLRAMPVHLADVLPSIATVGTPLEVLRTAISIIGPELGWSPMLDIDVSDVTRQTLQLCSVTPTILAATHRLQAGYEPIEPREDLSFVANYLWMLLGKELRVEFVRSIEQYLILMIDHGFNASTFTARVIASTGADLASAICGAIGSLSGPLHGGAPSRALSAIEEIGSPEHTEAYVRDVGAGTR
ncbi:MAG TPA: citrate/2-methylcitrate synthase [Acidimicrobiales bacterium]|jgi:citrate synthase|nr:citrate/2-methylcitrate synthase [Acidimicrobiales bacterium]